ncbi:MULTISPECIES: HEAT repeat domain-containing protein [unclassified Mesorhizobium]|uniref:HEAT repeat domain-containing protein n=1 Tax=unclassified Mesorhizobium TaxID=325217 RepID=UPI000FCB0F09|nr:MULTISPECIES: HEAT repeat domain-containing protein [unclassified Mesorhizobium]TGP17972.1 HEAT repeat domain-containing protein [Mesorhizobium sp. M1D.F.Ca.ET.231.01.1.1]TGP24618.1 HEAT repeat domain-containing protein [Mesorhizobium sp. M1D.F.Ca.ET.234.01.1.1]TGS36917.1 HEAT repeat domain-containing protein [Mesorhizobium sp. M1D.F.Ca.ET.184.01.1.1]TGS57987.1 HEAT repeat domain-containing protein [Mesorhizobium sp. M1D.F.Ca.ET.183.01.1.1]
MTDLFEAMRLSAEDSETAHLYFSEGGKMLLPLGKSTNAMTGQEMLERLLSPSDDDDGTLANDLLGELGNTVPLESLRLLLTSANAQTRAAGAFLATFQNQNISSMVGELAALLADDNPRIRFDAVESIMRCSTRGHGNYLARALFALDDENGGVRTGAIEFVRFAKDWQLKLARPVLGNRRYFRAMAGRCIRDDPDDAGPCGASRAALRSGVGRPGEIGGR